MITNSALKRRIQQSLYMLKREYGGRVDLYKLLNADTDSRTGRRTVVKDVYPVERAIILPANLSRIEKRGISVISANKQLVQGGQYEGRRRRIVIDRSDVPEELEITTSDWFVFDARKYEIETVEEFEFDAAWIVSLRAVSGEVPEQIHLLLAESFLSVNDNAVF